MDKKVLVISSSVGKTPNEIAYYFIFDEVYRLVKRGLEIHIVRSKVEEDSISHGIYFHGIKKMLDPQAVKSTLKNILEYPLPSLLRNPISIYWEANYALNVIRIVEKYDIDLIHAHFAYPEGLIGMLAKKRVKKPLVITCHGYDILVEPSVNYGLRLSKRFDSIICKTLNEADAVVTASNAVFNEVSKFVENDRIVLIPNGVDVDRFNPNLDGSRIKGELGIGDRMVVFSLRLHEPRYGLEYLIRAAPLVVGKNKDVVFVIGGDGSLRKYHEQLAVKLGVKEKIIFTGKIPRNRVPYYYAMSNMVVVPSLQEAFGLVITEAMASGKPVIGTNVGGIPDQIIDGFNGFLVKPKDFQAIAEKIIYLVNNPGEAKRMGMNGRKIVELKFNIEKRIDKIIDLYQTISEV